MNKENKLATIAIILAIIALAQTQPTQAASCCITSTTSYGQQYESFDNISTFTITGTNVANVSQDTNTFIEGTAGLKLYTSNALRTEADLNWSLSPKSISGQPALSFWVYVDSQTDKPTNRLEYVQVLLSNTSGFVTYVFVKVLGSELQEGWNPILVSNSTITQVDGLLYGNNTFLRMRVNAKALSGKNANVTFDNFRIGYTARPKAVFTFDDNFQSVYNIAYPKMSSNNQKGVVFVMTGLSPTPDNLIANGSYMNLTTMKAMYAAGWDMGSHTVNHEHLVNNFTTAQYELTQSHLDLISFGFTESAQTIGYPFGSYNESTINIVASVPYLIGRTTVTSRMQGFPPLGNGARSDLLMPTASLINTTTNSSIQALIDSTIEKNGFLYINVHDIVEDGQADIQTKVNKSVFNFTSDYLASRASQIDVIVLSDVLVFPANQSALTPQESSLLGIISIVVLIAAIFLVIKTFESGENPIILIVELTIMAIIISLIATTI